MPVGLLNRYLRLVAKLEAEEIMWGIRTAQAPHMKPEDAHSLFADLLARAGIKPQKIDAKQFPMVLASMGIGVKP